MANCGEDDMVDLCTAGRTGGASSHWDQRAYMQDQCTEIARHKWIESERAGRDLGDQAVRDWVVRYAALFRRSAEASGKYRGN